jgi:hypothetical protein
LITAVIVWDIESVPDLDGFAAANDLVENRARRTGSSSNACIGWAYEESNYSGIGVAQFMSPLNFI